MENNESLKRWQGLSRAIHSIDEILETMPRQELEESEFYRNDEPGQFYDTLDRTIEYVDGEVERKMQK